MSCISIATARPSRGHEYISDQASAAVAAEAVQEFTETLDRATMPDALAIACFGDPGLWTVRGRLPIPVVGMAEASCHVACQMGRRFGLVTVVAGLPIRTKITPGQTSDCLGFDLAMADTLPEPGVPLDDRGYDADNIREKMGARDVLTQIPMRKSREMRVGADRSLHALRNLDERRFNKLKNARRVATRCDKTAESFLGFIDIMSIRLWIRHLST